MMRNKQRLYKQIMMWFLSAGIFVQPYVGMVEATTVIPDRQQQNPARVSESANGITVVDIRRPNDKGLSHKRYQDLQVGEKGVIFNNSNKIVETQLAGIIKENPALVGTQAKTILNEVVGGTPTAIRGAMEIAGPKANLMIANPNGLYVNNGSFINTNRAVLTTGSPVLKNGELTDIAVKGGTIEVAGKGLDATGASNMELLAEAVKVNAGVWANDLRTVTGQNTVSMTSEAVTKTEDHTEVGLDVAAIGGMYANRITLVGTEKGLGVNVAGTVNALNGTVTVSTDGKVAMTGAVVGKEAVTLQAKEVAVGTTGKLGGAGTAITATTVTNEGLIGNTDSAKALSIQATNVTNDKGQIVSDGSVQLTADTLHNKAGNITGLEGVQIKAATLQNEQGQVATNTTLQIRANLLDNTEGTLAGTNVAVTTDQLVGSNQHIVATEDIEIQTKSDVALTDSSVQANRNLFMVTTEAITSNSKVTAGEALHLEGFLSHRRERLQPPNSTFLRQVL